MQTSLHARLTGFLEKRGLTTPDGRPLYAYLCSDSEYTGFEEHLKETRGSLPWMFKVRPSTAGAFCLWAAEWWHRHHEGGHWKWEPVLEVIGGTTLAPGKPDYGALLWGVSRGLTWWRRPLIRTGVGRAFLMTLACEGGLPLRLVLRETAGLRRYFRALLEEFRLFGTADIHPAQLAERVAYALPKTLRQDVVFKLSGDLIAEIRHLQQELGDTDTPLEDLEEEQPDWRSRLPLRVEDRVARHLLNSLLVDAAAISRPSARRVAWKRSLVRREGRWRLKGELILPAALDEADIREIFDVRSHESVPRRFELRLAQTGSPSRQIAAGSAAPGRGSGLSYRLEHSAVGPVRAYDDAASRSRLLLLQGRDAHWVSSWNGPSSSGACPIGRGRPSKRCSRRGLLRSSWPDQERC